MKPTTFLRLTLTTAMVASATQVALAKQKPVALSTQLNVEASPPERTGPLAGYAAAVERAAPSVVGITPLAKVEVQPARGVPFQFGDPSMRRYFGQRMPAPSQQPSVPQPRGVGSGVILTPDGYIATNNHVVEGADEVEVEVPGTARPFKAKVVGRDPSTDLALLKIDAENLPAITVGDSTTLKAGDIVMAIGNPFGLDQTVTSGIVSALGRRHVNIADYSNFIQTDASINPGNSGGALIDNKGRLMGINTAIFSRSGGNIGIGFAIPVSMAMNVLDRLSTDGEVRRGLLGVTLGDLTPSLAQGFGVETTGALINEVHDDTPAADAGFEPGDIVTRYRGEDVKDLADLRLRVAGTQPGTEAPFEIIRNGKAKNLTATIGELPGQGQVASTGSWQNSPSRDLLEGVETRDLDSRARAAYQIPLRIEGILVTRVDPASHAARAGLREGNIITRVAKEPVLTTRELSDVLDASDAEVVVLQVQTPDGARFIAIERDAQG